MDEHEIILQVLHALERRAAEVRDDAAVDATFWQDTLDFIVRFADERHHAKEEELLFPALVDLGMDADQGPVGVMKYEHGQARELTARMRSALEDGDGNELARAAEGYAFLLREHIQKENVVLFEMARQMLPPPTVTNLMEAFATADCARDEVDWIEVAKRICASAGIDFREPAPATGAGFEV